jgi:hypothetical protein
MIWHPKITSINGKAPMTPSFFAHVDITPFEIQKKFTFHVLLFRMVTFITALLTLYLTTKEA